jgi:hypothetical protein
LALVAVVAALVVQLNREHLCDEHIHWMLTHPNLARWLYDL